MPEASKHPEDDLAMSALDHLYALRGALMRAILGLIPAVTLAWWFRLPVRDFLIAPLKPAWQHLQLPGEPVLHTSGPAEAFMMYFRNSMIVGVLLASPWIFWQLWSFVAPALYRKERRLVLPFVIASSACFIGGAWFGYRFVFPKAFEVLLSFNDHSLVPQLFARDYMPFFQSMLLAFGVVFEVPVVIVALVMSGVVSRQQLLAFSRWWVVIAAFIAMVLTPNDVYSMVLMLVPLLLLYYIGIALTWIFDRKSAPTAH